MALHMHEHTSIYMPVNTSIHSFTHATMPKTQSGMLAVHATITNTQLGMLCWTRPGLVWHHLVFVMYVWTCTLESHHSGRDAAPDWDRTRPRQKYGLGTRTKMCFGKRTKMCFGTIHQHSFGQRLDCGGSVSVTSGCGMPNMLQ